MKPAPKPKGRWWVWPFGIAVLAVALLSLLRWIIQPERLGRFLLERAEAASGLDLEVSGPPRLGIWPRLHLQLVGLEVRDPAMPRVLLASAEHVALYLPLSSLGGEVEIDAVALHRPVIDLTTLARRSARATDPPGKPWLPAIASLEISDGRLVDEGWSLEAIELQLAHLLDPAADLEIDLAARLLIGEDAAEGIVDDADESEGLPLRLSLLAANPTGGALEWGIRRLEFGGAEEPLLQASEATLALPEWSQARLRLLGRLIGWPASWPALPDPASGQLANLDVELHWAPGDSESALRLWLAGPGRSARIAMQPEEFAAWLEAGDWFAPLPGEAELAIDQIEVEGVRIEGLQLRHGVDGAR
ncbi:hypothetical protein [Pseudomarimonas salicorniae]|uniref:AsmA family protein n=1 Tax=Pseudomarimonas salicorniae TaxID=2933270 RepID=A0ABT0GLN8_9GAMM|nr:hypothetical protein [Lysobacter sp. CAU 1642]MCK7595277.1 hypothetical protein [Lysobacter sp. CAU 1642]